MTYGTKRNLSINKSIPVLLLTVLFASIAPQRDCSAAPYSFPEAKVITVNDGDTITILLDGSKYRVRLIGIDAPEMGQEPWGRASRDHLRRLLKDGRWRVSLEQDIEHYDKYNRLLVYLWTSDGRMLNEEMLQDGYAVLFTIQPNSKYSRRFRNAERIARENRRGIWGPNGLTEKPLDYKKTHPRN